MRSSTWYQRNIQEKICKNDRSIFIRDSCIERWACAPLAIQNQIRNPFRVSGKNWERKKKKIFTNHNNKVKTIHSVVYSHDMHIWIQSKEYEIREELVMFLSIFSDYLDIIWIGHSEERKFLVSKKSVKLNLKKSKFINRYHLNSKINCKIDGSFAYPHKKICFVNNFNVVQSFVVIVA